MKTETELQQAKEILRALLFNAENCQLYVAMLENRERFDDDGNAIPVYSPEMERARAFLGFKGYLTP